MNREIKLRAWDKKGKKMINIENWWDCATEVLAQSACSLPCEEDYWNKNIVIQQSTGLYDKNGKEIFEGDIVKIEGDNVISGGLKTISFENGCFQFNGTCWNYGTEELNWETIEIIGNIYQNPELSPSPPLAYKREEV